MTMTIYIIIRFLLNSSYYEHSLYLYDYHTEFYSCLKINLTDKQHKMPNNC